MAKWKEERRGKLAAQVNNHQTEFGDWDHPGIGHTGADGLIRGAWQHIAKSRAEARVKRTFPGDNGAMEEQYRNTHR